MIAVLAVQCIAVLVAIMAARVAWRARERRFAPTLLVLQNDYRWASATAHLHVSNIRTGGRECYVFVVGQN